MLDRRPLFLTFITIESMPSDSLYFLFVAFKPVMASSNKLIELHVWSSLTLFIIVLSL